MSTTSTSLAFKSKPEVVFSHIYWCYPPPPPLHLRRLQSEPDVDSRSFHLPHVDFYCISAALPRLPPPSPPLLTSQYCTVMSFDTRNAIARFIGWFRQDTRERVCVPPGFLKPLPLTRQNPYPWGGYGFSRVRVRVALGYPRVTRDNH